MTSARTDRLYLSITNVHGETLAFGTFPSRDVVADWLAGLGFEPRADGRWAFGGFDGPGTPIATIVSRRPNRQVYDYQKIHVWPPNIPGAGRWDNFTGY